ncbi:MAG: hypothetical protein E3J72_17990 [Planctomycetota bacterium]|nr:MAG: hypothetical protein E3J72_17990 [Planctomycetota bacterium]
MPSDKKNPDENRTLLEVRPNWVALNLKLAVIFIVMTGSGLLLLLAFLEIRASRLGTRVEDGGRIITHLPAIALFFITFIPSSVLMTIHVFWLLRARWTLRATPKGILYRTWFGMLGIPWRWIEPLTGQSNTPVKMNFWMIRIMLRPGVIGRKRNLFIKKGFFEMEKDRCGIYISRIWTHIAPRRLARKLEIYRMKFTKI